MASNKDRIYIPQKIKVGFQKREGTFTGKLAYVIYYDNFGKLRKETSWNRWCDEEIPAMEIENEPTSGLTLNKGIKRYSWSHYGSGRSMIRIYDPRGFEYEIEPGNLVGLLMHTDCNRREIRGDLVYAWHRGDLLLLPTSSEEYKNAKKYTQLQSQKVSARDLVPGRTYVTKAQDNVVYLGRYKYHEVKTTWGCGSHTEARVGKNQHMFIDLEGKKDPFPIASVAGRLAAVLDESPHEKTGEWTDAYLKSSAPYAVKGYRIEPWDIPQDGEWHTACTMVAGEPYQAKVIFHPTSFEAKRHSSRWLGSTHTETKPAGWYKDDFQYKYTACGAGLWVSRRYYYGPASYSTIDIKEYGKLIAILENGKETEWPPKN